MISIQFTGEDANQVMSFQAKAPIAGEVRWSELPAETDQIQVRLIWYTEGKGTQDFAIITSEIINTPVDQGSHRFQFVAPNRPSSFSGKLISLIWAIEVILFPSKEAERKTLVISPSGKEILLTPIQRPNPLSRFRVAKMNRQ